MPHNTKRNGSPQSAEAGWRLERQPREGAHHPKGGHGAPNPPAQPTHSIPPQAGMEAGLTQRSPHPGAQRHGISASRKQPAHTQAAQRTHDDTRHEHTQEKTSFHSYCNAETDLQTITHYSKRVKSYNGVIPVVPAPAPAPVPVESLPPPCALPPTRIAAGRPN